MDEANTFLCTTVSTDIPLMSLEKQEEALLLEVL